jgi:hypothetical protein
MTSQEISAILKQVRVGSVLQVTHRYLDTAQHFEERVRKKVMLEDYTPYEVWFSGDSRIQHKIFKADFWFFGMEAYVVLNIKILEP